jgi:predicted nucleic acid-binding Zn ribbon protein
MFPKKDTLKPISTVLNQIAEEFHLEEKKEYFDALRGWDELAGPKLAAHTRPLFIKDRILHVEIDGSAWAQEIGFRKNAIVQGVNNRLGRPHVRDIRTTVKRKKK